MGLILVGGGARSGKSRFAESLVGGLAGPRVFVATAEPIDTEMRERIVQHQEDRGGRFETIEAPLKIADALEGCAKNSAVLLDCLTVWIGNAMHHEWDDQAIENELQRLIALGPRYRTLVVVTNEVGLGLVPPTALGRRFRDVAGRAHQLLASAADEVYLAALGAILRLKPKLEAVW
ncbi:MAG: bifunctional adenosylcobinamide kinase/adenosylcobinamide-phosphate guanylyltransferase [Myxococcota bacterium]